MAFSANTKLGSILRNPDAKKVLFDAAPEVAESSNLNLIRSVSLERLTGYMAKDRAWLDGLVAALGEVNDNRSGEPRLVLQRPNRIEDAPASSAPVVTQPTVSLWGVEELSLVGPVAGNPFVEVELGADFHSGDRRVAAHGFYDGDGTYRIRFMPDLEGRWTFRTWSNVSSLDGIEGSFHCGPALPDNHGPVQVANQFHFRHADGTPYRPIGTTCYAWTHQDEDLEQRTLRTLAASPFNKIRMCVFPKDYLYNHNEPRWHAFEPLDGGAFDLTRFNPAFFRHLEDRVADLAKLGIQADLILFHPYDRWGYSELPPDIDDLYVRYVVARLAAHANVWWSLANEYDFMWDKQPADWDRIGRLVHEYDPHRHLLGIHQGDEFYDHSTAWVTHCSIQRIDNYRTAENVSEWRTTWQKPIVIDECAYEGDLEMIWGNITGEEMTRRCWEGAVRGGYVGHGETYYRPDEVLWWAKGGELRGESVPRIAFLRSILEDGPEALEPIPGMSAWGYPTAGKAENYYLQYLGSFQPHWRTVQLPDDQPYRTEVIDTWNMTILDAGVERGTCRVELPGRPYMALRLTRMTE